MVAILPVYILQLCYGMSSGYPAITTPQLTMDCAKFFITGDQESWIGEQQQQQHKVEKLFFISVSIDNIATPVVCILSGYLQHKFGPKRILMLSCLPYILGWSSAGLAGHLHSVKLLYVSRCGVKYLIFWGNAFI